MPATRPRWTPLLTPSLLASDHTRRDSHTTSSMPPFDDWNVIDDEEDEELQDTSVSLSLLGLWVH